PASTDICWLAPDKHFLPVQTETFFSDNTSKHPNYRTRVTGWHEVRQGLFAPVRATDLRFDVDEKGMVSATTRYEVAIHKISLNPDFPLSKFRDIAVPDGLPVYVQKKDVIVHNYVQGEAQEEPRSTFQLWMLANGILFLGVLLLLGVWQW